MRKGFTLVELVVVIMIMGILVAGYFYLTGANVDTARVAKTQAIIEKAKKAIYTYYQDTGYFPTNAQQLWNNVLGTPGWYGPYVEAPNANPNLTYFPHAPWGGTMSIVCVDGTALKLTLDRMPQDLCSKLDQKIDDGSLTTGRVRWENNSCVYYVKTGAGVKCK
jgi:general secretion pathway protein G